MPVWGNGDLSLSSGFISSSNIIPQTGDNLYGVIGSGLFGTANPAAPNAWGFATPGQAFSRATTRDVRQFINSISANWKPRDWLATRAIVGLDFMNWQDAAKIRTGEGCPFCGVEVDGLRAVNRYNNERYSVDAGATVTKTVWNDFNSKTAFGAQWNRDGRFVTFNSAKVLPPGGATIDAGAQKTSGEQTTEFVTFGVYVEQQIGWKDKLFVTGAVRRDQNSAFGQDFGAAVYPKATLSWVARENSGAKWVNNFRPRLAWGVSGQQPTANASITFLNPVTATLLSGEAPAAVFGAQGNNDLKPERSREIEGGFDFATLRNRVSLQVTYYDKRTDDAIVQRDISPSQTAGRAIFDNVGVVSNKGLEVSFNARVLDFNNLQYDAQIEASWNKNELVSLAPGIKPFGGFGYQNAPGRPLFSNYWPNMTGFKDANGDGVIVPSEVTTTTGPVYGGPERAEPHLCTQQHRRPAQEQAPHQRAARLSRWQHHAPDLRRLRLRVRPEQLRRHAREGGRRSIGRPARSSPVPPSAPTGRRVTSSACAKFRPRTRCRRPSRRCSSRVSRASSSPAATSGCGPRSSQVPTPSRRRRGPTPRRTPSCSSASRATSPFAST
jgi:outer membrane receptor protein involved in Fe transport